MAFIYILATRPYFIMVITCTYIHISRKFAAKILYSCLASWILQTSVHVLCSFAQCAWIPFFPYFTYCNVYVLLFHLFYTEQRSSILNMPIEVIIFLLEPFKKHNVFTACIYCMHLSIMYLKNYIEASEIKRRIFCCIIFNHKGIKNSSCNIRYSLWKILHMRENSKYKI